MLNALARTSSFKTHLKIEFLTPFYGPKFPGKTPLNSVATSDLFCSSYSNRYQYIHYIPMKVNRLVVRKVDNAIHQIMIFNCRMK